MAVDGMQRSQITHLLAPGGGEICGLEILSKVLHCVKTLKTTYEFLWIKINWGDD